MRLRTSEVRFDLAVDGGTVTTRSIPGSEMDDLNRRYTTVRASEDGTTAEQFDEAGYSRELFSRLVASWSGYRSAQGGELPCDDGSKALVWEHDRGFCKRVLVAHRRAERTWAEETLGNS